MDNYIFVSGSALWVFIACVVIVLITCIILGCGHIKTLNENYKLKLENEMLNRELEEKRKLVYKTTFKIPMVEQNG